MKNSKNKKYSADILTLTGHDLNIENVEMIARRSKNPKTNKFCKIQLADSARAKMAVSRKYIENEIENGAVIYGVNTGFGAMSSVRISPKDITELQFNLIRSHAAGVGAPFSKEETRAIMLLRANTLARGHSGVRPEVVDKILEFLNNDVIPFIPSQGSVGASGDLAPLAHLALALIGEGEIWPDKSSVKKSGANKTSTAKNKYAKKIKPLLLQSKEGLSLINGCQVMTAVGLLAAHRAQKLVQLADVAGAMTLEALRGSRDPFTPIISESRPHRGEKLTAQNLLRVLGKESEISKSHIDCDRVQDAYSLRCMPAVHGAVKDALKNAIATLEVEANSSTDNPLVFVEKTKSQILSCGNFHGEPVAFQMDFLAIALSALGNISQCRISRMINPQFSALPAFLAPNGGLNSGLMMVEVAAASLVSENKIYSHPASVDSIPTSTDKEDHVSMGTIAARKLKMIVDNLTNILSMEVLASMQALSLLKPLKASAGVKSSYDFLVKDIPLAKKDRLFSKDVAIIKSHIESGELLNRVLKSVGALEL